MMNENQMDTLPKLMKSNYDRWGNSKIAMRHKIFGVWREFSWQDHYENVKQFALGLKSMGFQRGDKLCIIGDNEPQWYWAEFAAQSLGGVSVGIFVDSVPDEIKYIVGHSESVFVVVRDQEQTDKILMIRESVPRLKKVIYWNKKGMWSYHDPFVMSFEEVKRLGEEYARKHPKFFEDELKKGKGSDLAVISYTSGTSGLPKGAMISFEALIAGVRAWFEVDRWLSTDNYVSYTPPAWIAEQVLGITGGLLSGAVINFTEIPETLDNDIREIGPSMILYSSRLWESLGSRIMTKIEDGTWFKRMLFNLFLPAGFKMGGMKMGLEKANWIWKVLYWIGNILVFRSLRDRIGLKNTRIAYTGGSLISPGTFRLFGAIGVDIRDVYGSSEASPGCGHFRGEVKFETIGRPFPGMEIRLTKEGEMLWRGPSVFMGYYKDPEKTKEVLIDGWVHSGDAGHIDEDGHIVYLDRISDMIELEEGVKYSPQHIEGSLKFSPYIRDAIGVGGGNIPFVAALIQIDFDSVGKWAERNNIAYTTFSDLSQKHQVYDLIQKEVEDVNSSLPPATKIKVFLCLYKELDADEAELTRTRKLRRDFINKKYSDLLDAISAGKSSVLVSTEIKYRDGSEGMMSIDVSIRKLFE